MTNSDIRKNLSDLYTLRPYRVYGEMILSALLGWTFFALSLTTEHWYLLLPAAICLYRGLSFIHEISHLYTKLPFLEKIYNILLGYPNRVPAYTLKTHRYHHGINTFGSTNDPEYEKWTSRPKIFLARPAVLIFFYPLILTIRFGIIPLFYIFMTKSMRLTLYQKISSFVMNLNYIRPYEKNDYKDFLKQDISCALYFVLFCSLALSQGVFTQIFASWYVMTVFIFLLNTYRALVAHRYQNHLQPHSETYLAQLKDSVTIEGGFITELWAPIGLQYHSTHHMLPSLPYYSLAKAHKRLKKILPKEHIYHQTIEENFFIAFKKLILSCESRAE